MLSIRLDRGWVAGLRREEDPITDPRHPRPESQLRVAVVRRRVEVVDARIKRGLDRSIGHVLRDLGEGCPAVDQHAAHVAEAPESALLHRCWGNLPVDLPLYPRQPWSGPSLAKHVLSTKRNIPNRFDREHSAIERHRAVVRIDLDRRNGAVPGERVASNRAGVLDGDEAAPASDPTLDPSLERGLRHERRRERRWSRTQRPPVRTVTTGSVPSTVAFPSPIAPRRNDRPSGPAPASRRSGSGARARDRRDGPA